MNPIVRSAVVVLAVCLFAQSALADEPLYEGLGTTGRKVTAANPDAEKYVVQGIRFLYGFSHGAAIRSFEQAARLDPTCAMAYWGIAVANGPHVNFPLVPPPNAEAAWKNLQLAKQNAGNCTPVEKDLIEALSARYANPQNSGATVLLALILASQHRANEALAALHSLPRDDALAAQTRDVEAKILSDNKRYNEAYAIAAAAAAAPGAGVSDFSRLGDVLQAMKRSNDAANAYTRAVALAHTQGLKTDLWPLLLLQANALEQANRWPEAKQALQEALTIAPEQPVLLNFLGYAKLERGEDLDSAEAMIRKASELAPDDASITDSLGWAQFKRGKIAEAIGTLQRAAEKDPDQAEIQEHLGDALFKSGRRFEARFAWQAGLVTAEDDVAGRLKAKLTAGLTPTNAAP